MTKLLEYRSDLKKRNAPLTFRVPQSKIAKLAKSNISLNPGWNEISDEELNVLKLLPSFCSKIDNGEIILKSPSPSPSPDPSPSPAPAPSPSPAPAPSSEIEKPEPTEPIRIPEEFLEDEDEDEEDEEDDEEI